MYIAALIGSIFAFVCSFVPLFGIPFSIVFAITAIVFSILVFKKSDEKERKDASIIALIISVLAIIICIFVNILSKNFIIDTFKKFSILNSIDYESYYNEKFENYANYEINNDIVIKDECVLKVNNFSRDKEKCYIDISIEALEDNTYFSIYNLGLYDSQKDEVTYALSSVIKNEFVSGLLQEGDNKNISLEFKLSSKNTEHLYLVFIDSEHGVKIKL